MSKQMIAMMAIALCMVLTPVLAAPAIAADAMMKVEMTKDDKMMSDKMIMKQQIPFTEAAFMAAQKSGQPFLVAFHKKGCTVCAKQQHALNAIYADPMNAKLGVLVVDYDHDTASLKKFNVGQQSVLITFKGEKEITRTEGVTGKKEILAQLEPMDAMMNK